MNEDAFTIFEALTLASASAFMDAHRAKRNFTENLDFSTSIPQEKWQETGEQVYAAYIDGAKLITRRLLDVAISHGYKENRFLEEVRKHADSHHIPTPEQLV